MQLGDSYKCDVGHIRKVSEASLLHLTLLGSDNRQNMDTKTTSGRKKKERENGQLGSSRFPVHGSDVFLIMVLLTKIEERIILALNPKG